MISPAATAPRLLQRIVLARRTWQWLLVVMVVVVSYLAITPRPPTSVSLGWDKLNHASAFVALAFTACLAFPGRRRNALMAAVWLFGFGALIEVVQLFVPGRDGEWEDLFADSIGITLGTLIALALLRAVRARR